MLFKLKGTVGTIKSDPTLIRFTTIPLSSFWITHSLLHTSTSTSKKWTRNWEISICRYKIKDIYIILCSVQGLKDTLWTLQIKNYLKLRDQFPLTFVDKFLLNISKPWQPLLFLLFSLGLTDPWLQYNLKNTLRLDKFILNYIRYLLM